MAESPTNVKKLKPVPSSTVNTTDNGLPELVVLHPNALSVIWPKFDLLHKAFSQGARRIDIQISAMTGQIPKSRPATLYNELRNKIHNHQYIKETRFTRSGNLIITSANLDCLLELANISSILQIPVKTQILTSTLTTRYLVRDVDTETSIQEIGEECLHQGLSPIRLVRFTRDINGTKVPSPTILVEELGYHTREHVYLWYTRCRVDKFTDRPRQCANCARFGHAGKQCNSKKRCFRCGEMHDATACTTTDLTCPLCSEDHMASNRTCKVYLREVEILNYAAQQHITLQEARRKLPPPQIAYATVAAPSPRPVCSCEALLPKIFDILTQLLTKLDLVIPVPRVESPRSESGSPPPPHSQLARNRGERPPLLETPSSIISKDQESPATKHTAEPACTQQLSPERSSSPSPDSDSELMDASDLPPQTFYIPAAERLKNQPRKGGKHPCCYCSLRFTSFDSMTSHLESHIRENTFPCPHCSRKFPKTTGLLKHLQIHHQPSSGDT